MMNWLYGYGYNGGWMFFMPILWIIFFGIIIYFIVQLVGEMNKKESIAPIDILKERYVKWEITKEEFEAIKKDLE